MQIIVFGMHRSGTSPLTRIINLMGAYVGPEGTLMGPTKDNPKGYWEREDVHTLHRKILHAGGAAWDRVSKFDLSASSPEQRSAFAEKLREIVLNLEAHRPWVLKDPRMCVLFPLWRNLLEVPVCVLIYRSPLQVAESLKTRNGFSLQFGIALWEQYNLAALANTQGFPRLLVSHSQLMEQPIEAVRALYEGLVSLGVQGLRCPGEKEIRAFIDPALYRERGDAKLAREFLNHAQMELLQAFADQRVLGFESIPPLSAGALEAIAEYEIAEEKGRTLRLAETERRAKEAEAAKLRQQVAEAERRLAREQEERQRFEREA
ncbi:MAG TPA: hypothetical protein VGX03_03850, partial [Candidatus Binatia bacterium]|nr:hypothetical protein [Candidatus Binatia bacterium]